MIKNISSSAYVGSDKLFDTATLLAYKTQLEGLTDTQTMAALSSAGLTNEQQKQVMAYITSANATKTLTSEQVLERLSTEMNSKANAKELLGRTGLISAKELDQGVTITLTEEKKKEILTNRLLDAEEKKIMLSLFGETTGKSGLTAATWELVKAQLAQIASSPVTWILGAVAAVALLVKGYDALIGRQEKLARTKLEDLDEDISTYDEEIQSLETLQTKLESAKGNKSELAKIQNELNDAIGETTGLLDGEGQAYDIANAKLKANIELKKRQRKQAQQDKVDANKDLFNNNSLKNTGLFGIDWLNPDITGNAMRKHAKTMTDMGLTDEQYVTLTGLDGSVEFSVEQWKEYWNEQVDIAYEVFADTIDSYDGAGGQDFIKGIISNAVKGGFDLSEISDIISDIINNQDLQDKINLYWESLINPDMNSEDALNAVKTMIDGIIKQYPQLQTFFNDFYNDIVSGANVVADTVSDTANKIDSRTKMISSINDMSEGFQSLDKIFASIKDQDPFDFKLLDDKTFKETFGKLDGYTHFIEQITSNSDDIGACKDAFNQLVTEWIASTGILNNLTNENANLTISMLEQMGVGNAEEIVLKKINAQKEASAKIGKDFVDITDAEIDALIAKNGASQATIQYLAQLRLAKLDVNKLHLDTKSDVDNIVAIANAAGTSAEYVDALEIALNNLKNAKNNVKSIPNPEESLSLSISPFERQLILDKTNDVTKKEQDVKDLLDSISKTKLNASDFYTYNGDPTSNKASKDTKETFNWIETALSRLQRSITNFGKTVSATWKSWTERNSALKSQISEVTKEIGLQQQAADKYWNLAESVSGVGDYKELIKNGALDMNTITDENTINAIKQYQEYYEAYLSALDAKQDAEDELANLVREDFDMIAKQFDSEISLVEANISTIESYIDQAEMKGNLVSKNYYSTLYAQEEKNLSFLQQKYDQLSNNLSNSSIVQGSEAFNEMSREIKEVNKAIIESNTKLEEYQKTMRELDWEVFDLIQDKIGNVTEESEFLIDLLSKSKLFNEDGSITSQGQATLGLHVANMKIYESQVKDYADEIARLDEEFANDPLDQNYLERREELVELQRDAILNCQNEKDSIKDLMSEGYDNLLSYMDKLISKRKDLLSQASDARSFQKTVKEQTDEIARLQNIIGSYGGSLSEEDRAIVQKHQVSLESAQEDLEDTLYDQYISDTEKMLDLLVDNTEGIISTRLDDTDGLIDDVVQKTEENTDAIKETLVSEVSNVGGTISTAMETIWSGTDGVKGVVNGVNTTLTEIKNIVQSMVKSSDTEANQNTSDATSDVTPATTPVSTPQENPTSTQQSTEKEITVGGLINASGALIYSNANGGGGSRQYYRANPIYTVLSERNGFLKVRHQSLSSGTTGWFKKSDVKAYKTGGLVDYTGLAWVDGQKGRPEAFLNANDTELFAKLRDSLEIVSKTNMFDAIQSYTKIPNFVTNGSINNSGGDIIFEKIEMYGVNDPQEFAKQLKEVYDRDIGNVRKMINTDVHSKYGSMNYRRYL